MVLCFAEWRINMIFVLNEFQARRFLDRTKSRVDAK